MSTGNHSRNGLDFLRDGRGIYGLNFRMKRNDGSTALIMAGVAGIAL